MEAEGEAVADAIEARLRTGRPMGGAEWIAEMEDRQGRPSLRKGAARSRQWTGVFGILFPKFTSLKFTSDN